MCINYNRTIVVGRSLGTGPAIHISTKFSIGVLVLISPFKSIRAVAKSMVGSLGEVFVNERFNNLEKAADIKSPVLILHG